MLNLIIIINRTGNMVATRGKVVVDYRSVVVVN